ncbi:MAG: PAS domain S-box protein [Bacteroidetes bacterium]|nr:PAS domain S-box protein [Bacteroidota bacterium]
MTFIKKIFIHPKSLLIVFLAVAAIIITSIVSELIQSKKEVLELMQNQSHSLLETMLVSSKEVLLASDKIEEEINNRLLNNAAIVKILFENGELSNRLLKEIAEQNGLMRINIFNKSGKLLYSNIPNTVDNNPEVNAQNILSPIFTGEQDTLIVGVREARAEDGYRYVVGLSTRARDAIVLNLDAQELLDIRRSIGFGVLLTRLTQNEGVVYTAIQGNSGLMAASQNVWDLDEAKKNSFLKTTLIDTAFAWHLITFSEEEVFEAVHPFELDGEAIGVFRIGLSLAPLNSVNERSTTRIIISGIVLLILGSVLIALVYLRQDLGVIKKEYNYLEGFSQKLFQDVKDAIIVLDGERNIKEINLAGLKLFNIKREEAINSKLAPMLCEEAENNIFNNSSKIIESNCSINGVMRVLLLSKSEINHEDKEADLVLIIKDLTELKELEKQAARNEQLFAMAHLASGVAHEIRNPLNTIGTIAQQLDRDFEPVKEVEQYHSLSKLVYNEVKRINRTIENFLKFAKPLPISTSEFNLMGLMEEIETQYKSLLAEKNIKFSLSNSWAGIVKWDRDQIRQVLMNFIENAKDAIGNEGEINLLIGKPEDHVIIIIEDNGKGIAEEDVNRIFNLYFTTKAEGTGVGLSMVQRIVSEHEGVILVESELGKGTRFTLKIMTHIEKECDERIINIINR